VDLGNQNVVMSEQQFGFVTALLEEPGNQELDYLKVVVVGVYAGCFHLCSSSLSTDVLFP